MATIASFSTDCINYGSTEVAGIYDDTDKFIAWINAALVNRHEEVCALYNKWTTTSSTFSTAGYELSVPSAWDWTSDIILYTDSDHQNESDTWKIAFGVIRFDTEQAASTIYYIRYRAAPTTYTATTDTFAEIANPRLKKILMEEVIALYLASENDLEDSNREQRALNNANKNS